MTAPTPAKAPKPVWNWKDDDCVRSLAEALRNESGGTAIAARLMRSYTGRLTNSAVCGAMNRPHVLKALRRVADDAESLINAYRARSVHARNNGGMMSRTARTGGASRSIDPPRPPRVIVKLEGEDIEPVRLQTGEYADALSVTDSMCVYTYERGNSFIYCGRARVRGSYCADHGRLIYRPNTKQA